MPNLPSISAADFATAEGVVIDIRTPAEHEEIRLTRPHILMPLNQLDPHQFMEENNVSNDTTVYILCRIGGRAVPAAEMFINSGYSNVKIIEGGILACEANGIDVE